MRWEYESFWRYQRERNYGRRRRTTKRCRYDSDAGKFVAKFDGFEGWYDIVLCTVIGRGVDTYGSIDHLAFLIDLDDYLVSNPGKQYTIA